MCIRDRFKAFAKAIKMAVKRDAEKMVLPSTKAVSYTHLDVYKRQHLINILEKI